MFICHFLSFNAKCFYYFLHIFLLSLRHCSPPASSLVISFIWWFLTDTLIFRRQTLNAPTPICLFSLLFALCRFGSDNLHLWKNRGGGGGLLRSHDQCTWFPSYQKAAAAASRQHHETSITAREYKGVGDVSVEIEHEQHTVFLLWNDWDTLLIYTVLTLSFLTFSLLVHPTAPRLFFSFKLLDHTVIHNTKGSPATLDWPSKPLRCFVWT